MQIREKNGRFYLLRSSYDPTKKRSVQGIVAVADRSGTVTPHEGVTLTDSEAQEWAEFWRPRQVRQESVGLRSLQHSLRWFQDGLKAHPEEETLEKAEAHMEALQAALDALRKHSRKLRRRKPAPEAPRLLEDPPTLVPEAPPSPLSPLPLVEDS